VFVLDKPFRSSLLFAIYDSRLFLTKSQSLAAALGVTKFDNARDTNLVTLCRATQVRLRNSTNLPTFVEQRPDMTLAANLGVIKITAMNLASLCYAAA
jgi:hypothetical protein